MEKSNNTAKLTGILFLTAMAASLVGGGLIETVNGGKNELLFATGVFLEIVNALSVLGIGILLYPILKNFQKKAAQSYLLLRVLEVTACLAAPLVLIAFSNGTELRILFTGKLIPLFFCSGAIVLYSVLFQYRLLPRFISVWGFTGVAGIIVLNLVNFKTSVGMLLAFPIILNEIFMGIWLIVKGFNKTEELYVSKV